MFRTRIAVPLPSHAPPGIHPSRSRRTALARYGAMLLLGLVNGAGGTALTVSLVQAGNDAGVGTAVPADGERRVSLLRDGPGDSVVLDGKVTTFEGSSNWPYNPRNFRDFRSSSELTTNQRRMIDDAAGISSREGQMLALRRDMTVRETKIGDGTAIELRGRFESGSGDTATASNMQRIVISPET